MRHAWVCTLALALCAAAAMPAMADFGDKPGWSVSTDRRGRAFLMWVLHADGPRIIMFGCLRDAHIFTTMSYAVGERAEIPAVKLTLSNGSARFEVGGSITRYPRIGRSSFFSDLTIDDQQLQAIGRRLLPVLEGPGDLTLAIVPPPGAPGTTYTRDIPSAGLRDALGRFREVCFR